MIHALRKWLRRRVAPWRVTRYNVFGFECERWNRRTGEFQHRHYTDLAWTWKPGRNPHRRNAFA